MSLFDWRRSKLQEYNIHSFFYFSHKDNIETILKYGILPKNEVHKMGLDFTSFAEEGVQYKRDTKKIKLTDGNWYNIHDLVPLYLTPRTPTLYSRKNMQSNFFFCVVQSFLICSETTNFAFSDGNAASHATSFHYSLKKLNEIPWDVIRAKSWNEFPDGKRKRNSEFLIYPKVPVSRIWRFVVNNAKLKSKLESELNRFGLEKEVTINQRYFF